MDEKHDMTFFYANVFHNLKWIEKKGTERTWKVKHRCIIEDYH